jgi:single-stranded-DNA-specific exonuclease
MIKLKNSSKATKRLVIALKKGEKMAIWSDYDPDGAFALVLAYEAMKNAGFKKENLKLILPNQIEYGRSFNEFHLKFLKKQKIKLILGMDFGTTDFEQISMAQKMGFEVILLDHHRQRPGRLPAILINPWQKKETCKCRDWNGTAVVYLFFEYFYKILKLDFKKLQNSLDLLFIPIITDHIKIVGCNLPYIKESLKKIKNSPRPGLKASLEELRITNLSVKNFIKNRELFDDFYGLLKGDHEKNNIFKLLTCTDYKTAKKISKKIKNQLSIFENETSKIVKNGINSVKLTDGQNSKFIFWGIDGEEKFIGEAGKIAQDLNSYFKKPVYFYSKFKNMFKGNARVSLMNGNVLDTLKSCSNLFVDFGGHPRAAGFYIKSKNLLKLKKALEKYYESK